MNLKLKFFINKVKMEKLYNENVMLKKDNNKLQIENNQLKTEIEKLKQYKQKHINSANNRLNKLKNENPEKLREYWRTANANRRAKQQAAKSI